MHFSANPCNPDSDLPRCCWCVSQSVPSAKSTKRRCRDPRISSQVRIGKTATQSPKQNRCVTLLVWFVWSLYSAELCELSQLAWRGVEESRIVFLEEDVPRHILDLSIKTGLFSQVRDGYTFTECCKYVCAFGKNMRAMVQMHFDFLLILSKFGVKLQFSNLTLD